MARGPTTAVLAVVAETRADADELMANAAALRTQAEAILAPSAMVVAHELELKGQLLGVAALEAAAKAEARALKAREGAMAGNGTVGQQEVVDGPQLSDHI